MNSSSVTAHPLSWPQGWPRTKYPARSRFDRRLLTIAKAVGDIGRELKLLGASKVVISTNLELRQNGLPYSNQRAPKDAGVAVYFTLDGREQCIPCDRWERVEENLWAIACSIGAIRGLDRWGAKSFVDAAFRGFKALPESTIGPKWWEVLGCESWSDVDAIRARYRALAMERHPDKEGGSEESFRELQVALGQGLSARGTAS